MIVVWFVVDEVHIATLAVHPGYRGRGLSKPLLIAALREAVRRGFRRATLEVRAGNLVAQNLYLSFGFEVVGVRSRYYRDNNEDAWIMTTRDLEEQHLNQIEHSELGL
jgi:ribosomal-protein-alanine N-acetyltransferase